MDRHNYNHSCRCVECTKVEAVLGINNSINQLSMQLQKLVVKANDIFMELSTISRKLK